MATFYTYGAFAAHLLNGRINFPSDTIKLALCTSSYVYDQDTHDYFDDITNELSTANGYTAGGQAISNKSIGYTAGTNVTKVDADDVVWSSSSITARIAVLYKDTGTPSTSPLIGYVDFGEDKTSDSGNFTVTFDAAGIFTLTTG